MRSAILTALLALLAPAWGAAESDLSLKVSQKRLSNGLTVLVVERPVPLVALAMMMPAGNIDSPPGKTGLPHMLEHMLFKGTTSIGTTSYADEKPLLDEMDRIQSKIKAEKAKASPSPARLKALDEAMAAATAKQSKLAVKGELDSIYSRHGGRSLNAWTSDDATCYTVLLPANKMGVFAALETERFAHPVFREFYSERQVVMQERRDRIESNPYALMSEALNSAAYRVHPYHNPTIGYMKDIEGLLRGDIQEFYEKAYRPDRGVLAVVGGVKAGEVFSLLEGTLGQVPNPSVPPLDAKLPEEPPQTEERRVETHFDADPVGIAAWHQSMAPDPDAVALAVLAMILGNGNSARLNRDLVFGEKLATSVNCGAASSDSRAPGLFSVSFVPVPGVSLQRLLAAIDREIDGVKAKGVRPEELDRAKRAVKSSYLWSKDSLEGMAAELAGAQALKGDWRVVPAFVEALYQVDSAAIQKAAGRWLVDSNRSVLFQSRPAAAGAKP
jgi:predicted Zn-dependent peptidase